MPPNVGEKQEQLLYEYLRIQRRCQVIEGDQNVRDFLAIKGTPKCADALGLNQHLNGLGHKRLVVAESKVRT